MKYVVGHKCPDTDSVCTIIAWSWYLNEIKKIEVIPIIQGEPNKESDFILKYWQVATPKLVTKVSEKDEIFLMDTTNPEEMINGYEKGTINAIIDHHKLGGLSTSQPLEVVIKAYGCTATVFYEYIMNEAFDIKCLPKEIAGLMVSAIISDTLFLKSPTTTKLDREAIRILSEIAQISNVEEYANRLFDAKSDVSDVTDKYLINSDAKRFVLGNKKVLVSVVETTRPKNVLERVNNIKKEMLNIDQKSGYDFIAFFVIDIINQNAYYIVQGNVIDKWIASGYEVDMNGKDYVLLPGIISRKKQIIPVLEKVSK